MQFESAACRTIKANNKDIHRHSRVATTSKVLHLSKATISSNSQSTCSSSRKTMGVDAAPLSAAAAPL
ncbi:hypothetical protein ABC855_g1316 [[Candida] zeylanoides]